MMRTTTLITIAITLLTACDGRGAPDVSSATVQAGIVVDSARPIAEELRRFREGLVEATQLEGGADTREALVRGFMGALDDSDTTALRRMAVTRAEYAYLLYPESPLAGPPYNQPPGMAWMLLQQGSNTGATRLFRASDGSLRWQLLDQRCPAPPVIEGRNRLWRRCEVRVVRPAGDTAWARLFGTIVEREGRFKFLGYANDF